jgi:hypothetical protein
MSWTWEISAGKFYRDDGLLCAVGYSGQPPHVNDITAFAERGIGPIPPGHWQIAGIENSPKLGENVLVLIPDKSTMLYLFTLGREPLTFRIHGERKVPPPGFASDGCIVLAEDVRLGVWNSTDHELDTIATLEES